MTKTDVNKLITYWTKLSAEDWDVMKKLARAKAYAQALFFLHLSLEKFIKAQIVKETGEHAPYSHDLSYLVGKTSVDCPEQILVLLRAISKFNMESRYPDENLSFYKRATKEYAQEWIKNGTKVRTWLSSQFKSK